MKLTHIAASALLVVSFAAINPVNAAPIQYSMSFTLISNGSSSSDAFVTPTSGSFYYDPNALPSNAFSNFIINWIGVPVDFTAAANNPQEFGGCGSGAGGTDTFAFLTGQLCTGTPIDPMFINEPHIWRNGWPNVDGFTLELDQEGAPHQAIQISGQAFTSNPVFGYGGQSYGTFSVTEAPEPSTWAMMIAALIGLGFVSYRSRRRA